MYAPNYFQVNDPEIVDAFIHQNEFAILVSVSDQLPVATHLPVELMRHPNGEAVLYGHVARANPQWKSFQTNKMVMAIFSGPHAYVSARWYDHVNVPTWNYIAVHVYGRVFIIEDEAERYALLKRLVERNERGALSPYRMEDLPESFLRREMKGLVAFKILVEKIETAFKLSQNRDPEDYETIINELHKREDPNSIGIAAAMRCIRPKS